MCAVTAQFRQRSLTNRRAKTSVRPAMRNLKLRGDIREPVRGPVENPRLDRFIRSRYDECAQAQHDETQELLAVFAGLQQAATQVHQACPGQGTEQYQGCGGADAEDQHKQGYLTQIPALARERSCRTQGGADARTPYQTQQQPDEKLTGEPFDVEARHQLIA